METKHNRFIHLLTPMHVGGNFEFSVVDQPIQREGHTGFPKIEASSLKGSIRHHYERKKQSDDKQDNLFGSANQAGKLIFTDASLLFFPIRSASGVYALITCPAALKRWMPDFDVEVEDNTAIVTGNCLYVRGDSNKVLLDEYLYEKAEENEQFIESVKEIQKSIPKVVLFKRALLLSDNDFAHFVKYHTEIITRIAIDSETGTVNSTNGALFDEEYVPAEAIFYTTIYGAVSDVAELNLEVLQIGANMTLGKGFVKVYEEGEADEEYSK